MKPGPKPGMNLERHQEIGLELALMCDRLTSLTTEVANAYPKESEFCRQMERLLSQLRKVRSEGENAMFKQHGEAGSTFFYYPTSETRAMQQGSS